MRIQFPVRIQHEDGLITMVETVPPNTQSVTAIAETESIVNAYRKSHGEPVESSTDDGRRTWVWRHGQAGEG